MAAITAPLTREDAIAMCRRMSGTSSHSQIQRELEQRGYPAARATVRVWADPEAQERNMLANRNRKREQKLMARMRVLRDAGVTYSCIARVVQVDSGFKVTEDMVRYALATGRLGVSLRRQVRNA